MTMSEVGGGGVPDNNACMECVWIYVSRATNELPIGYFDVLFSTLLFQEEPQGRVWMK